MPYRRPIPSWIDIFVFSLIFAFPWLVIHFLFLLLNPFLSHIFCKLLKLLFLILTIHLLNSELSNLFGITSFLLVSSYIRRVRLNIYNCKICTHLLLNFDHLYWSLTFRFSCSRFPYFYFIINLSLSLAYCFRLLVNRFADFPILSYSFRFFNFR